MSETSDTISDLSDEDIEELGNNGNGQGQGNSNNSGNGNTGNSGSNGSGSSNSGNGSNTDTGSGSGTDTVGGSTNNGNGNSGNSGNFGTSGNGSNTDTGSGGGGSSTGNGNSGSNAGNSGSNGGSGSNTDSQACTPVCGLITEFGENIEYESNLDTSARTFDAFWGRWAGPNSSGNQRKDRFAWSDDTTSELPSSGVVKYQLVGATDPTDQTGKSGTVHQINMTISFDAQQIQSLNLDVATGTSRWDMVNAAAMALGSGSNIEVDLTGSCSLACAKKFVSIPAEGISTITLAGPGAEGALGTYNLNLINGSATVTGAFLLEALP